MSIGPREAVSGGGERPPAWALNLLAHPEADVQIGSRRLHVAARLTAGHERAELWSAMTDAYQGFDDYAAHTAREIPVFALTTKRDFGKR